MAAPRPHRLLGALVSLACALLLAPGETRAAEFRYDEDGTVRVDAAESIDDTVFLAGETAVVAGVVDGDVFAAAERVEITGTIRGNLYAAGESVTIAGQVGGNVHAAGEDLKLEGKVAGSGFLAARNLVLTEASELARGGHLAGETVQSRGRIGRALYFAAAEMEVGGNVERKVRGYGRQVRVRSNSSLAGDMHLTVPTEEAVTVEDGATVRGKTLLDVHQDEEHRTFLGLGLYLGVIGKTLAMLLLGVILAALFPSLLPAAPESGREALRDMGIGFLALVATPVAIVLIAMTLIGIPVSVVLAVVYAVLLFLSTLVVAYLVGQRLPSKNGRPARVILRTGISLLLILFLVKVPFVGPVLSFLIHILGLGALLAHLWNLYRAYRDSAVLATEARPA